MKILILGKGYIGNYLAITETDINHKIIHISKSDLNYEDPNIFKGFLEK